MSSEEPHCPRCGAPHGPDQEYCLECGYRLQPASGVFGRLAAAWQRRFGWYPGDWIWPVLLSLVLATAGAVALFGGKPRFYVIGGMDLTTTIEGRNRFELGNEGAEQLVFSGVVTRQTVRKRGRDVEPRGAGARQQVHAAVVDHQPRLRHRRAQIRAADAPRCLRF